MNNPNVIPNGLPQNQIYPYVDHAPVGSLGELNKLVNFRLDQMQEQLNHATIEIARKMELQRKSRTAYNWATGTGFRVFSGGAPLGWTLTGAGATATQTANRSTGNTANYSVLLASAGNAATLTQTVPVFPGMRVCVAAWVLVGVGSGYVKLSSDGAAPAVCNMPFSTADGVGGFMAMPSLKKQGISIETPTDATTVTITLGVAVNSQLKFAEVQYCLGPQVSPQLWTPNELDSTGVSGDFDIPGDCTIDGKLTVAGSIDPTDLTLNEQASIPDGNPASGYGKLWAKDDQTLHYTDSGGNDIELGALTAVSIASAITTSPTVVRAKITSLTAPAAADFTALNSATLTDVTTQWGAGVMTKAVSTGSTGSNEMKGGHKSMSYSSGTLTLIVGILGMVAQTQYPAVGVYFRESGTSKLTCFNLYANSPSVYYAVFGGADFSGPSGATWVRNPTGSTDQNLIVPGNPMFFKLTYDGTDMKAYFSVDMNNWIQCATVSKTEYFTTAPDQWGWFCNANTTAGDAYATLIHWEVT